MAKSIRFKCTAKTDGWFRTITVDAVGFKVSCDCDGFNGIICSHIDATLVAGERFMVPEEERKLADQAMKIMDGKIVIPADWKGAWRQRSVWRGLKPPGTRNVVDHTATHGEDYHDRPKICFTGQGPKSRNEHLEDARLRGWKAVDSFQADLKVLVAANPAAIMASSKLKQARKNAIPILSYEEWETLASDGVLST